MRPRVYYASVIVVCFSFCGLACTRPVSLPITFIRGTVTARTITVVSGTTGEVKRITKGPGDRVAEDELLLRLDPKDSAEELAKAREKIGTLGDEEKKAAEELDRTTAEVSYSRGRYLTFASLFKKGAVARREVDRLKDEWEFAEAQHKKALAWYSRAAGKLLAAELELKRAEEHYGSAMVLAPADGYVRHLLTWEGGYLLFGEEAIVIARAGEVSFVGSPDEDDLVSLGQEADVWPLAFPTGPIRGYVARIVENGRGERTVAVRIFPESKKDVVNIGSSAWAVLYITR